MSDDDRRNAFPPPPPPEPKPAPKQAYPPLKLDKLTESDRGKRSG